LRKWIERVRDFYQNPGKIPSLANALFGRKVAADPKGDHKPRKMRSERREACCALLGAIAHYCDLPTLCLSVPQPDGTMLPLRMDTLAERAGLTMRRAERAMRDIVAGGLVGVYRRCELQDDGTYIGRAAIRVVPPSFFGLFGLEERLQHDRRRISQKRIEARENQPPTRTAGARIHLTIDAAIDKLTGRHSRKPPAPATPPEPAPIAATPPEPAPIAATPPEAAPGAVMPPEAAPGAVMPPEGRAYALGLRTIRASRVRVRPRRSRSTPQQGRPRTRNNCDPP
jgi:hypothetical protein